MLKSNLPTAKVLASSLLAMTLVSGSAFANVYKWRDAMGRTQYSDTMPATPYSIVSRSELVNALQSKDVCNLPNTKRIASSLSKPRQLSANFNWTAFRGTQSPSMTTISRNIEPNTSNSTSLPWLNQPTRTVGIGVAPKVASQNIKFTPPTAKAQPAVASSIASIPTSIVNITKFVATHAMPAVISPAQANTVVINAASPPVAAVTIPAPSVVAINLPPNIVQVAQMPAVDISKNVTPAVGYSELRIQPTTEQPPLNGGAFRVTCAVSHMSNDDPLVYPNQPGAAHHHTFFGNTTTNAKSDLMTFASTGSSTCNGGIMNRSAYWVPSMIDTSTNTPIKPDGSLFYYKTGDFSKMPSATITAPPKGLRMITGNAKATTADAAKGLYTCITAAGTTPWKPNIVNCAVGDTMQLHIDFPQCWDGVNLDSPDHKSHMSFRENVPGADAKCPSTHPVMIPSITLNLNYKITSPNQTVNWRLASDNYASTLPGGYSTHADWVNGWDEKFMAGIIKNCLQKNADCHAHLLGDGRTYY